MHRRKALLLLLAPEELSCEHYVYCYAEMTRLSTLMRETRTRLDASSLNKEYAHILTYRHTARMHAAGDLHACSRGRVAPPRSLQYARRGPHTRKTSLEGHSWRVIRLYVTRTLPSRISSAMLWKCLEVSSEGIPRVRAAGWNASFS